MSIEPQIEHSKLYLSDPLHASMCGATAESSSLVSESHMFYQIKLYS